MVAAGDPVRRLALTLLLTACGDPATEVANPTWTDDIQPLYEAHCIRCHQAGSVQHDGVQLDTYAAARATRHRSACTAITADLVAPNADILRSDGGVVRCGDWEVDSMPPGTLPRLTRAEMELLLRWLEQGAPE